MKVSRTLNTSGRTRQPTQESHLAGRTPTRGRHTAVTRRVNKIAFFGHFGWANFGNESTIEAMLSYLRRLFPSAEFSCVCTDPETVAADYNITAVPTRRAIVKPWTSDSVSLKVMRAVVVGLPSEICRWLQGFKTLWNVDALVVPGTGILNDAYGLFGWGPYDMFRWLLTAKLCRCKLLIVSVGAGPIYSRAGRFFVRTALRLADFRSYRDEASRQWLKRIGFAADKDPVYPDLAFSLPATVLPPTRESNGRRLVVGLGLMEYAGKYGIERRTSTVHRAYLQTLAEFVEWLVAHDYNVRLLIGDMADTAVTQEFRAMLRERLATPEDRIIDEPVSAFPDVLSQIAATDFVVGTRFHNILFSILLNKPTIAISFHHKCSSLMSQMGLADYCEDINHLQADRLIEQFGRLKENADSLKAMLKEKVEERRDALDEQYSAILQVIWPDKRRALAPAINLRSDPKSSV